MRKWQRRQGFLAEHLTPHPRRKAQYSGLAPKTGEGESAVAISRRLRYEILRRDNHTCRYCGAVAPMVSLTVDHVTPVSLGGRDEPDNLVAACVDCNAGKASSNPDAPLVADVQADALRWARAMQFVVQAHQAKLTEVLSYIDDVDTVWTKWKVIATKEPLPRPQDWRRSAEIFFKNDVSIEEWEYAVARAMGNDRLQADDVWKYTCGILWSRIKERVEAARTVVVAMEAEDL